MTHRETQTAFMDQMHECNLLFQDISDLFIAISCIDEITRLDFGQISIERLTKHAHDISETTISVDWEIKKLINLGFIVDVDRITNYCNQCLQIHELVKRVYIRGERHDYLILQEYMKSNTPENPFSANAVIAMRGLDE